MVVFALYITKTMQPAAIPPIAPLLRPAGSVSTGIGSGFVVLADALYVGV